MSVEDEMAVFRPAWAGVGQVASAYGGVESSVRGLLYALVGDTPRVWIAGATLSTGQVIGVCRAMLREDDTLTVQKRFGLWVMKVVEAAGAQRNDVAHGSWHLMQSAGAEDWRGRRMDPRGGPPLTLTAEQLEAKAFALMCAAGLVNQLAFMVQEGLAPSAHESEQQGEPMRSMHDEVCDELGVRAFYRWDD